MRGLGSHHLAYLGSQFGAAKTARRIDGSYKKCQVVLTGSFLVVRAQNRGRGLTARSGGWRLVRGTDAGGEGTGTETGDVYIFFVGGQLIEGGEQAFGLGEEFVVVVALDLQEHVVYA